ncbi:MAG: class I SAM-dependent methyltransferase [Methyloceanibacter sp.]
MREGMTCLDMGCGGGDVSFELAMIAGPKGRVLGIDIDNEKLAIAREEASAKRLENVEFRNANAMHEADEIGSFDFTFARQLLCHVPDPAHVLKEMIAYASPGGLVAVEDIDFNGYFCHPPCPALDLYMSLVRRTMRSRGGNADIGPELPGLLIAAGLEDVEMRVVQPAATQGEIKLIQPITMDSVTEAVVADGLANASHVKEITDALYDYAEDPKTVMSVPRYIQAWGRTPQD